jgi:hemophore-related protein
MVTRSMSKLAAAAGGLALSVFAGAGIASADVVSQQAIDTTCNYDQVVRALDANSPGDGQQLNQNGLASAWLRGYLASGHDARVKKAQDIQYKYQDIAGKYIGEINAVAATCNNF